MQRARQGRLKVNAMASHPAAAGPGGANHQARQLLVLLAARHFEQVLPELLFGVGVGKNILWRLVHAAQVAGVLRIAAAPFARRGFEELDRGASLARHQRSTKRGVAATDDQDINQFESSGKFRAQPKPSWRSKPSPGKDSAELRSTQ